MEEAKKLIKKNPCGCQKKENHDSKSTVPIKSVKNTKFSKLK